MKRSERVIVLHYTKTGENTLVLHCLCRGMGRRGFVCNVRKGGSVSMFMPLSILDVEVSENPKSDLWRVSNMSVAYPFTDIRTNMYKNAISMFMSEVLYRTIHEGAWEPGLFEWCEKSTLTLEELPDGCANFHIRWLMELCSSLGFSPEPEDLAPFAGKQFAHLQDMLQIPLAQCLVYPLSGSDRSEMATALIKYLGSHLEREINIRSLSVLQELFK